MPSLTVTFTAPATLTREQIGARLQRTGLKISKVRFHGAQGRPRAEVDPAEVRALSAGGASLRAIAEQLGCSHGTVANILGRERDIINKDKKRKK